MATQVLKIEWSGEVDDFPFVTPLVKKRTIGEFLLVTSQIRDTREFLFVTPQMAGSLVSFPSSPYKVNKSSTKWSEGSVGGV